MSITKRFINIVKTNRKNFDDEKHFSPSEIDDLLRDDSADELSRMIAELGKEYFPYDIKNAFLSMEIQPTRDLDIISLQFKNLINKYHPDRNSNGDKQFFNNKTSEIISAHNKIKKYLEQ